jgi:hypothetical protein
MIDFSFEIFIICTISFAAGFGTAWWRYKVRRRRQAREKASRIRASLVHNRSGDSGFETHGTSSP